MSAAAARRRKQLAARKADQDVVGQQLNKILQSGDDGEMDETTAYEAMQLAQSVVRKKVHTRQFTEACDLAYSSSLALLKKKRVSVASQLLSLLAEVLRETHTAETEQWVDRIVELCEVHSTAMEGLSGTEAGRLHRLQRDWLRHIIQWSSELGTIHFGHYRIHAALGELCWKISRMIKDGSAEDNEEDSIMDFWCDAVQHMTLAEKPDRVVEWLKTLPSPSKDEVRAGHTGPPAVRDALLTRCILLLCAIENLRDANKLVRGYLEHVEHRKAPDLAKSYTSKDDGKAPSHVMFCSMLVRVCEKEVRTGPLYSWLLRSFRVELDRLHKPQAVQSYTTKIGKVYFNIQPPPSMMSVMESMLGGGMFGGGGMNPADMLAAMRGQM